MDDLTSREQKLFRALFLVLEAGAGAAFAQVPLVFIPGAWANRALAASAWTLACALTAGLYFDHALRREIRG